MADDCDRASKLEMEHNQRAQDEQRRRANFDRPSLAECEECGESIPEARQAFGGITLCIDCQAEQEIRERRK